jgi:uncharacterized protein YkwD
LEVETLESREVLSGYAPTAYEQLFLERLNDARANPAAYGASIGLDLSSVAPSQPLAFDTRLIQSARLHSQDMAASNYFGHNDLSGQNPGQRMLAAGYPWTSWGESIAAGYPGPEQALYSLIIDSGVPDLGHRRHLLAIDSYFKVQQEIGIGVVLNGGGAYSNYYTLDSGQTADTRPFLTGVLFNDANHNGRYDLNEGRSGLRVEAWSGNTLAGAVDDFDTGGYSLQLNPGIYQIRVMSGTALLMTWTVALGSQNVRLNLDPGSAPPNPADVTWVTDLGRDVLRRGLQPNEIADWTSFLRMGGTRSQVAQYFAVSGEYRHLQNVDWVSQLAHDVLHQDLTSAEAAGWANALDAGWNRMDVGRVFVQSAYAGLSDSAWITRLAQDVFGRTLTTAEFTAWTAYLRQGGSRDVAAQVFIGSSERRTLELTRWVRGLAQSTLARSLSTTELGNWVNYLVGGGSQSLTVAIYTTSSEYFQRNGV